MCCGSLLRLNNFSTFEELVGLIFVNFANLILKLLIKIKIGWHSSFLRVFPMSFHIFAHVNIFEKTLIRATSLRTVI